MDYKEEAEEYLPLQRPVCCHCDDPVFQGLIYHNNEFTCLECLENMSTRQLLRYLGIDVDLLDLSFYC